MMPSNFVFENSTKIYFGPDQLVYLPEEIKRYGKRVLLAYGGGTIKKIGLFDKIKKLLEGAGIVVVEFGGIEPNPRHTTVNRGAQICREQKVEVILAVGGGSTIDCSKVIAAARYYEGDAWDLVVHKAEIADALPLCTVLTLAATGSEMDCGGVISNIDTNEKIGLIDPRLQPKVSFLDPTNTFTVNAYQTASGSADIIAHILDICYLTKEPKMEMLDLVMEAVLKTVVKFAPIAVKEPYNYEARANLMWAASWALNGFLITSRTQAATSHCIEHELSAFYDITHGHGLAILMPRWLEYILDETTASAINQFGVNVFGLSVAKSDLEGAKAAIDRFRQFLFDELGLTSTLTALGINDEHFAVMARKACGGEILHGYRDLTSVDVQRIFEMCR